MGSKASVAMAIDAVISSLVRERGLSSATLANRTARMERFASFLQAQGTQTLDSVAPELVGSFIGSRRNSGKEPTLSERHSRLGAVRLLYREARRLGLAASDPTLDAALPPRNPTSARPLLDSEIETGRRYAVRQRDLRPAVCWALAEATARTSEMPHIRVSHLDLAGRTVLLHGGATTVPRTSRLTVWGATLLRRRIESIGADEGSDPVLMVQGHWDARDEGRAAATMALVAVLKSARLSAPGINPRSIASWAGRKALEQGASIDTVARMLGVRSLDQAAALIDFNWRVEAGQ